MMPEAIDLRAVWNGCGIDEVLGALDTDLVGLLPVKQRIREIASLLVVDKVRRGLRLEAGAPSLHMSFTGNPGTGKTTVAMRMAELLHKLGYCRTSRVVAVTRDDLVGQYIGHTAPKTKEVLKRATGGVLFIDEAYYLYRPENERDYGQEAIEILLQVMENERDHLVVIFAGYRDRMETFFRSNPGLSSRVAHHIEFPDYDERELSAIAELILEDWSYQFSPKARAVFAEYIRRRRGRPHFANARSVRNALDRARLRHARRLLESGAAVDEAALRTLEGDEFLESRVFRSTPIPQSEPEDSEQPLFSQRGLFLPSSKT